MNENVLDRFMDGESIGSMIKNKEYDRLYTEIQKQVINLGKKLPEEYSADFSALCGNFEKLAVRSETEGFKLGVRAGFEIFGEN